MPIDLARLPRVGVRWVGSTVGVLSKRGSPPPSHGAWACKDSRFTTVDSQAPEFANHRPLEFTPSKSTLTCQDAPTGSINVPRPSHSHAGRPRWSSGPLCGDAIEEVPEPSRRRGDVCDQLPQGGFASFRAQHRLLIDLWKVRFWKP